MMKMKKINYTKIVNELNATLKSKYDSLELINKFEDLSEENFRTYFTIDFDQYNNEIIYFSKVIVYSVSMYDGNEVDEAYVVNETKIWFNKYIDVLNMLKY